MQYQSQVRLQFTMSHRVRENSWVRFGGYSVSICALNYYLCECDWVASYVYFFLCFRLSA